MSGYTKMFSKMLDSSVWMLSKDARLLWITMLLKKDRRQVVEAAVPGLAHAARLTVEETEAALEELEAPDPYSQSREMEGRRLVKLENGAGWLVVNGEKYRDLMDVEDRRTYNRLKKREERQRKKKATTTKPLPGEAAFVAAAKAGADQAELDRLSSPQI